MSCVVVLSGGLDSLTVLAEVVAKDEEIYPFAVDYGQNNLVELSYAKKQISFYQAMLLGETEIHNIHISELRNLFTEYSSITDKAISGWNSEDIFYVPGRNLVFASMAASFAESVGANTVYMGFVGKSFSGENTDLVPDTSEDFAESVNAILQTTGVDVKLKAPFVEYDKGMVLEEAIALGAPVRWSFSCVSPLDDVTCGKCPSCTERAAAFAVNGVLDTAPGLV